MDRPVRVRFAPSPTGALHIGGLRTALYNYLFARKHKGTMVLRIEDTDQARYVPEAEAYINQSLNWLGITPDEGPDQGGSFGPYRQSERKDVYQKYIQQLIDTGWAYYAFDTAEELEEMRERLKAAKANALTYNGITRNQMSNSITLTNEEVEEKLKSGIPYVIRFKVPLKEDIRLNDIVRGWVVVHSTAIDDKVIMKSDGMPTYHLANVVDDHLMQISHVIRGEEWLPSAPLHVLLYRALGWESSMPEFAHLPLLLKPDGNGKLSKRDGDKHGYPVFPINGVFPDGKGNQENYNGFREAGYLPETMVNFLALLGWNSGTEQELYSLTELTEAFSLERINKAGAKFDVEKARWFNQQYIRKMNLSDLVTAVNQQGEARNLSFPSESAEDIVNLFQDRITFIRDIWEDGNFLFSTPESYDEKVVKKRWTTQLVDVISAFGKAISQHDNVSADSAKSLLESILAEKGMALGQIMQGLRVAITGKGGGPDLMKVIEILGGEDVNLRIQKAIEELPVKAENNA
ncbi:MAG: glutamate--tRNA ligase [Bacteroidota bacterium]